MNTLPVILRPRPSCEARQPGATWALNPHKKPQKKKTKGFFFSILKNKQISTKNRSRRYKQQSWCKLENHSKHSGRLKVKILILPTFTFHFLYLYPSVLTHKTTQWHLELVPNGCKKTKNKKHNIWFQNETRSHRRAEYCAVTAVRGPFRGSKGSLLLLRSSLSGVKMIYFPLASKDSNVSSTPFGTTL